ncbi:MAG: hypothetical protein H6703_14335 [Myxococcales bacterium]|nr:hypothetical protein [Myxococcales bacterium]
MAAHRIAALLAALAAPLPALAAPASPDALARALEAADRAGDRAAITALFTADFHAAGPEGAGRWLAQVAPGPSVTVEGVRVVGDRAALTGRIDGRPVVMLAVRGADGWRIDDWAPDLDVAVAFLAGKRLRPPVDPALRALGDRLAAALAAADRAPIEAAASPAFAAGPESDVDDFFGQFTTKQMTLAVVDARGAEGRGVITGDVVRGGRAVDRIHLLASDGGAGWRLEAITEDRERVIAWLAGIIPARFDVERLPPEDGAAALAKTLRDALARRDVAAAVALMGPRPDRTPGIGQPRARSWLGETLPQVTAVSPPRVHARVETGRAVAIVTLATTREGRRDEQTVWLYLNRDGAEWRFVDLGEYPRPGWVFGF